MKLFLPAIIAALAIIGAAYGICKTDNTTAEIILTIIDVVGGGVLGCYVVFTKFLDNLPK